MSSRATRLAVAAGALALISAAGPWLATAGQRPVRELQVSRTVKVGGSPAWLTFAAGALWVPDARGRLSKVDPRAGRVVWSRQLAKSSPYPPSAAVGAGSAWFVSVGTEEVVRIDPATGRTLARVATGPTPVRLVFAGRGAWIVNWGNGSLSRLEPATNTLRPAVPLHGANGLGAIATPEGLWVVVNDGGRGSLARVDPQTGKTLRQTAVAYSSGQFPLWDVTYAAGSLWTTAPDKDVVARVDPRTGKVIARVKIPTQAPVYGIAATPSAVWTASVQGAYRIDARTNTVDAFARLPAGGASFYRFVATGAGSVWVSDDDNGAVYQIRL